MHEELAVTSDAPLETFAMITMLCHLDKPYRRESLCAQAVPLGKGESRGRITVNLTRKTERVRSGKRRKTNVARRPKALLHLNT